MLKTLYDIFNMIFPNQDFGLWHERLAKICFFMAIESAKCGNSEKSLEELELMIAHIENYKAIDEISHTSLFVNKIKVSTECITKHTEETVARSSLRYLNNKENEGVFDAVKDDCRYKEIKKRLAEL